MKKLIYVIAVCIFFVGMSVPTLANYANTFPSSSTFFDDPENFMTIDVYINGTDKIQLENIPTEGYLEVYSILGVKVSNTNLKKCIGNCTLDLSKGIYILKVGKVARKIIVK